MHLPVTRAHGGVGEHHVAAWCGADHQRSPAEREAPPIGEGEREPRGAVQGEERVRAGVVVGLDLKAHSEFTELKDVAGFEPGEGLVVFAVEQHRGAGVLGHDKPRARRGVRMVVVVAVDRDAQRAVHAAGEGE